MNTFLIYSKKCWVDAKFVEATLHIHENKILNIFFYQTQNRKYTLFRLRKFNYNARYY